ncbi:hypothetical protein [Enterococcus faecium]|uniref:hypothetical protein n=1 Tax=Enterococcus faecium TaxID=1352 RepID=UPI001C5A668E|nr:hypothetical protein [Enterococcus faecium]QXZ56468.1 hypothetical protein KYK17_13230 [Enterococcus faecium]
MLLTDWLAITISIIAALFSVYTFFKQKQIDEAQNKINLNAPFFERLYFDLLINGIPDAIEKIFHDTNTNEIKGYDDLENLLLQLRKNSRFFEYYNSELYKSIQEITFKLEDIRYDQGKTDKDRFNKYKDEQNVLLRKLYKIILSSYTNGSIDN